MKLDKWKILWGAALILLSAFFYFVHYLIFRDPHHIFHLHGGRYRLCVHRSITRHHYYS